MTDATTEYITEIIDNLVAIRERIAVESRTVSSKRRATLNVNLELQLRIVEKHLTATLKELDKAIAYWREVKFRKLKRIQLTLLIPYRKQVFGKAPENDCSL